MDSDTYYSNKYARRNRIFIVMFACQSLSLLK